MLTIPPWNPNSGGFKKYTVQQSCSEIFTREVGAGSTGYTVQTLDDHGNAANTYTVRPGEPWSQVGIFRAGDSPFQIQLAAGSVFFDGYEKP